MLNNPLNATFDIGELIEHPLELPPIGHRKSLSKDGQPASNTNVLTAATLEKLARAQQQEATTLRKQSQQSVVSQTSATFVPFHMMKGQIHAPDRERAANVAANFELSPKQMGLHKIYKRKMRSQHKKGSFSFTDAELVFLGQRKAPKQQQQQHSTRRIFDSIRNTREAAIRVLADASDSEDASPRGLSTAGVINYRAMNSSAQRRIQVHNNRISEQAALETSAAAASPIMVQQRGARASIPAKNERLTTLETMIEVDNQNSVDTLSKQVQQQHHQQKHQSARFQSSRLEDSRRAPRGSKILESRDALMGYYKNKYAFDRTAFLKDKLKKKVEGNFELRRLAQLRNSDASAYERMASLRSSRQDIQMREQQSSQPRGPSRFSPQPSYFNSTFNIDISQGDSSVAPPHMLISMQDFNQNQRGSVIESPIPRSTFGGGRRMSRSQGIATPELSRESSLLLELAYNKSKDKIVELQSQAPSTFRPRMTTAAAGGEGGSGVGFIGSKAALVQELKRDERRSNLSMKQTLSKMEKNIKKQQAYAGQLDHVRHEEEQRRQDHLLYSKHTSEVSVVRSRVSQIRRTVPSPDKKESSKLLRDMKRHNKQLHKTVKKWTDDYWKNLDYKQQKADQLLHHFHRTKV